VLELITMIYNFFDQGDFYITRGYLEEMCASIGKAGKFTDEELKKYFFTGSFGGPHIRFS
jgi:hypothetical protein